jgi:hypothetical protein
MMAEVFQHLSAHWWWLILAAVLGGAEIVAPGFFLMWLAAAALATGIFTAVTGLPLGFQLLFFAVGAIVAIMAGRHWRYASPDSDDPVLNRRGHRMIGQVVTVIEPIAGGTGRVQVGDSPWPARGADAPLGARVRIVAVDGTSVIVELL